MGWGGGWGGGEMSACAAGGIACGLMCGLGRGCGDSGGRRCDGGTWCMCERRCWFLCREWLGCGRVRGDGWRVAGWRGDCLRLDGLFRRDWSAHVPMGLAVRMGGTIGLLIGGARGASEIGFGEGRDAREAMEEPGGLARDLGVAEVERGGFFGGRALSRASCALGEVAEDL